MSANRSRGLGIPRRPTGDHAAAGLWPTLIDPRRLENALLNLCINARDAMPAGGRINLETGNRWVDRAYAACCDLPEGQCLSVCATDIGLPGGMNGRRMADAARARRPDLEVLFITGYAECAAVGVGLLGPGLQVLTKPFRMDALGTRIRDLVAEP